MPLEIGWMIPCRVLDTRASGQMPALDIIAGYGAFVRHLNAGGPPVHVLMDVSELVVTPESMPWHRMGAAIFDHPVLGWWVSYGNTSPKFQYALENMVRLRATRLVLMATREEAIAFVLQHDTTLADDASRPVT